MTSTKRIVMTVRLPQEAVTPACDCRAIRAKDIEALAQLMLVAYRGTIDGDGETVADAREEIRKAFAGDYGQLLPACSFVIEQQQELRSACLVSWYEPTGTSLVVFLMTHPDTKRQGLARGLLQRSMQALSEQGYEKLTLVVTRGNDPALALYRSLGFDVEPTA